MGWIFFLLLAGIIMVCLEVFIPGGVVGALGGIALLASVVMAFKARGLQFGSYWLAGTAVLTFIGVFISIKYLPRSPAGKKLFLNSREEGYSSSDQSLPGLLGKKGRTETYLRPAGMVLIEDRRVDVVTRGEFIPRGKEVKVVEVEGNRVVVGEVGSLK
jgi:membrane-bound serine protease (ClpP class)